MYLRFGARDFVRTAALCVSNNIFPLPRRIDLFSPRVCFLETRRLGTYVPTTTLLQTLGICSSSKYNQESCEQRGGAPVFHYIIFPKHLETHCVHHPSCSRNKMRKNISGSSSAAHTCSVSQQFALHRASPARHKEYLNARHAAALSNK